MTQRHQHTESNNMATGCTQKVKRTRCKDLYDSSSSETEFNYQDGELHVFPVRMERPASATIENCGRSVVQCPVKSSGQYRLYGIDDSDRTKFLDSLNIDAKLTNTKYKMVSPGRQCLSESKVSAYLQKSKNIAASDGRKRRLGFGGVDTRAENADLKKRKLEQCIKREENGFVVSQRIPRSVALPNYRQKVDMYAELSAEEYKFRHHIGERNAVEKVVSYRENTIVNRPRSKCQPVESNCGDCAWGVTKEENNNTMKRSPCKCKCMQSKVEASGGSHVAETDADDKVNSDVCGFQCKEENAPDLVEEKQLKEEEIERDDASKVETDDDDDDYDNHDDEGDADIDDDEVDVDEDDNDDDDDDDTVNDDDDTVNGDNDDDTVNGDDDTVNGDDDDDDDDTDIGDNDDEVFVGQKNSSTVNKAEVVNTKAKTKKAKSVSGVIIPAPRVRRIASLTAQTKMLLLYEKDPVKPPQKKKCTDENRKSSEVPVEKKKRGPYKKRAKKSHHDVEVKVESRKTKKSEKSKRKEAAISVSTVYGNTIHVSSPVTKISLPPPSPVLWQQPINLTKMYAQPQFIPLQNATVLGDQNAIPAPPAILDTKRRAQKSAREKWKKKLANPAQGVRNSSRAASLNAKAVLANASPRKKRSCSDPGECKPKRRKQTLSTGGGQWVMAGIGPQYFIPNTNPVIFNQSALPAHTVKKQKKKKSAKSQAPLEGLGQQLLASAAGANVILPSADSATLDAASVQQTITIGGIGSLSTPTYMPVQLAQHIGGNAYPVPQITQAHFAQGFYQTGSILSTATVQDNCLKPRPVKIAPKVGKGSRKSCDDGQVVCAPAETAVPKVKTAKKKTTNGWRGHGEPFENTVFLQNDAPKVMRMCYNSIKRKGNEKISVRDCILLKSGPRKTDLPYVAKVAALWEEPEEGELMVSLLWYYRPEHIEGGRCPRHHQAELFACKHKDYNSVATIEEKCYVLTSAEYFRHCKRVRMADEGIKPGIPAVPLPEEYTRQDKLPDPRVDRDMVFFCRHVYDYRQKRILKNPS